jgi:hypothetical protein
MHIQYNKYIICMNIYIYIYIQIQYTVVCIQYIVGYMYIHYKINNTHYELYVYFKE